MVDKVVEQVRYWRDELLNLSRRDRVLYYRPTRSASLLVETPTLADAVGRLMTSSAGWKFYIPPEAEDLEEWRSRTPLAEIKDSDLRLHLRKREADELLTQKETPQQMERALRALDRRTRQEFMDKGLWVLYLVAGFLRWRDPDTDQEVKSPLVLIPVELTRASPRDDFRLVRAEEDIVLNPALAVRMETDFNVTLPNDLDDEDLDISAYLGRVGSSVQARGWSVERSVAVDVFSFHKEAMYKDLLENEEAVSASDLIRALALGSENDVPLTFTPPSEEDLDERYPPESTATILDADATQLRCIAAAHEGNSFVMDGPPGTGKSQTIANMIAQAIHDGQTVLFVSEKMAALDVVKARLDAVGLGHYLLELHSHKATRKQVAQQMYETLRNVPKPRRQTSKADLQKLKKRRRELSDLAAAVNEIRHPLGRSLHHAIGRISQLQEHPQAPLADIDAQQLDVAIFDGILAAAGDLSRAWGPVARGDGFVWSGVDTSFASVGGKRDAKTRLEEAEERMSTLRQEADRVSEDLELWWNDAPSQAEDLLDVLNLIQDRRRIPFQWLTAESLEEILERSDHLSALCDRHRQAVDQLVEAVGSGWRDLDPNVSDAIDEALGGLEGVTIKWKFGAATAGRAFHDMHAFASSSSERLQGILESGGLLAAQMGIASEGLTLGRVKTVIELVEISGSPTLPEPGWLDEMSLTRIREAVEVLSSIVDLYREKAHILEAIFLPSVLELDVRGLQQRFDTLHRGVKKLSSAYKADKRLLAQHTRTGKASKYVRAMLEYVAEWQAIKKELEEAEGLYASKVGTHYYQGVDSDFEAVASALEVAERAMRLASDALTDRRRFAAHLGLGAEADPELNARAVSLRSQLEDWVGEAKVHLLSPLDDLMARPIADLHRQIEASVVHLETLTRTTSSYETTLGTELAFGELGKVAEARSETHLVEQELREGEDADSELLGPSYSLLVTDWDQIESDVEWATSLREALQGPVDPETAQRLLEADLDPADFNRSLKNWRAARDLLLSMFVGERPNVVRDLLEASFDDGFELLSELEMNLGDIDEWAEFVKARNELAEAGLADAVEFAISERLPREQLTAVIERAVLETWCDHQISSEPRIKHTRSVDLDAILKDFRQLDREIVIAGAAKVMKEANARRPKTQVGTAGIIVREGQKKRKHMPVRELLGKTTDVSLALKPCFMMSPLSVSQFLPPSIEFDLVIFDEASQVRPCDAANSIYRGRQLVVAGDQRQLPPTSFFTRAMGDDDDEYHEDQLDEFESVLDLAKAGGIDALPLRWHYRSQHESLITFSNYSFYEGGLITFPGALATAPDVGVDLFKVDGVYARGGARDNPVEAEKVVERVLYHVQHHPHLTMGVVAFSEAQASTIEAYIDRVRRDYPELDSFFTDDRLSGFFVKNLESVQGDERDIMIFSIGYGPDEFGKITMNFGPLNKPGGERRLNVAITRARRRVEVVTSILPEDFRSTSQPGPRHLMRYLDYARRGIAALAIELDEQQGDAESPFEEEVARVIRSWGYDAIPQVGVAGYRIDIGVKDPTDPGKYVLAVECDGAMYHSSRVARDRDRLRQEVLEGLGWIIHRIWGTAWYHNRTGQEKRLADAIEAAKRGKSIGPKKSKLLPAPVVEVVAVDLDATPDWVEPYEVASVQVPRWESMTDPRMKPRIADAIEQVVAIEGPVHKEVALRRIREAWGLGRAGSRIREAFDLALVQAMLGGVRKDRKQFLWPDPMGSVPVRAPTDDPDSIRPAKYVADEELREAILHLVKDAKRVDRDELTSEVGQLFGWNRRGSEIGPALDRAVTALLRGKKLIRDGGFLRVPDSS